MRAKHRLDTRLARCMGAANVLGPAELAELAGLDRRTIWKFPLVRGETVEKIAAALDCPVGDLLICAVKHPLYNARCMEAHGHADKDGTPHRGQYGLTWDPSWVAGSRCPDERF